MSSKKEKKGHTGLFRGLTAVSAVLLTVSVFGTQTALSYTGSINSYLGTQSSQVVQPEGESEDTTYYASEFGELNAENLQTLIQATYDESVLEEEEGAVLLRNENNALPMQAGRVTLFGHAVVQPVYGPGGANSSAADTGTYVVDLKSALENNGFAVNQTLYDAYASSETARVASNNLQVSGDPRSNGAMLPAPVLGEESKDFYTSDLQNSWADDYNDAAIVMFAREGGEDKEIMEEDPEGISGLALHQDEKDLLQMIQDSGKFDKVIVLLNSAFPMEVEWLDDYDVDACLWIGNPGIRGFQGVANLLTGDANPSGRLVDTYAAVSTSSPAAHIQSQNTGSWSNQDEIEANGIVTDSVNNWSHVVVQQEGIYIGYKYYETRYEDAVLNPDSGATDSIGSSFGEAWNYADEVSYPFGYGLSYTTFDQSLDSVTYDEGTDTWTASVTVTNTGDTAGQSVVELYAQTPYGDYEKENLVEKSAIQLAGYGKTGILEPGQSETVTVDVTQYLLASYDYTNAKGYILSSGDYYFAIGDNAHDALNNVLAAKGAEGMTDQDGNEVSGDADKTYHWSQDTLDTEKYKTSRTGTVVTNQFDDANLNYWQPGTVTYLTRQDWAGTFPLEPMEVECTEEMQKLLSGEIYEKPDDAPSVSDFTQGENNNLTLAAMKDVDYDDDETWNKYLDQMTIEEMAGQLANMFGSPAVASVGKPGVTDGDGTASIGSNKYAAEYGDERDVCLYPSTVVAASTWSTERLVRRGQLMAEEALYAHIPDYWSGGGDLHRTPFGGRNGEYYSEDSTLVYLDAAIQLEESSKRGAQAGLKHLAGNDQELYREGLVMFFNEQAFREGSLRCFEGALQQADVHCLMQSFNRIGLVLSSSCKALCTEVLTDEWGWHGEQETDGVAGGSYKEHFPSELDAGADVFCIDPSGDSTNAILAQIQDNDDGYMLQCLRNAVKDYHYNLSRSNIINGMSVNATIERVVPWWEGALYALIGVTAGLTVVFLILYILSRRNNNNKIEVAE